MAAKDRESKSLCRRCEPVAQFKFAWRPDVFQTALPSFVRFHDSFAIPSEGIAQTKGKAGEFSDLVVEGSILEPEKLQVKDDAKLMALTKDLQRELWVAKGV